MLITDQTSFTCFLSVCTCRLWMHKSHGWCLYLQPNRSSTWEHLHLEVRTRICPRHVETERESRFTIFQLISKGQILKITSYLNLHLLLEPIVSNLHLTFLATLPQIVLRSRATCADLSRTTFKWARADKRGDASVWEYPYPALFVLFIRSHVFFFRTNLDLIIKEN